MICDHWVPCKGVPDAGKQSAAKSWLPIIMLACLSLMSEGTAAGISRKVIADNDGFGFAQWMLIKSPDVEVLGLTIVAGDVAVKDGMERARRGIEAVGRLEIPIFSGSEAPILNSEMQTSRWEALFGTLAWKGLWSRKEGQSQTSVVPSQGVTTEPTSAAEPNLTRHQTAAEFLIQAVYQFPGEVTVIATGPMTNIAIAQLLDPNFAKLAKELVYMGGSLNPRQVRFSEDATSSAKEYEDSPRREFNFRFDPEAAKIVLNAPWRRVTMVPLDPSTATEFTPDLQRRLSTGKAGLAAAIRRIVPGNPLWDEIAAAVWLNPKLVKRQRPLFIDVDTQFGPNYGSTLSWQAGFEPSGEHEELVIQEIDVPGLEKLMVDLLKEY